MTCYQLTLDGHVKVKTKKEKGEVAEQNNNHSPSLCVKYLYHISWANQPIQQKTKRQKAVEKEVAESSGRKKPRRKKKEEEEEGAEKTKSRGKKTKKVIRPKCTFRPKHTETHRNSRNTPKHPEILSEVEWGGVSYRFAYRYEIFRPFRPERNGIYNYGMN